MSPAKKVLMKILRKRGRKSLQKKLKREVKREEIMLVAKKGNMKAVRRRKGCKSTQKRLTEMLKDLKMKVAEKRAEMNREKELQMKWEAKLEHLIAEFIKIRRQNRLVFEENECTQLCIDLMLALLQALDEGDSVNVDLLRQSLRVLIGQN